MWSKNAAYKLCEKIQVEPARGGWRKFPGLRTVTLQDVALAFRWTQILGVLADTIILARPRTLFWHVDGAKLVWHVDGNNPFGMLTVVLAC